MPSCLALAKQHCQLPPPHLNNIEPQNHEWQYILFTSNCVWISYNDKRFMKETSLLSSTSLGLTLGFVDNSKNT